MLLKLGIITLYIGGVMTKEELADFCIKVDGMSHLDQRKIVALVDMWDDLKDHMHDELHEMNIKASNEDWMADLSENWKKGGKYGLDRDFLKVGDIANSLLLLKVDLCRVYDIPCRAYLGRNLTGHPEFMKIHAQVFGGNVHVLYIPRKLYHDNNFAWMMKTDMYRLYCKQEQDSAII